MARVTDARERLIEAVIELIWTGSYGSTSVDHICERAGVKKGSFYHFFESKTALAAEGINTAWAFHRAEMDAIFDSCDRRKGVPYSAIWRMLNEKANVKLSLERETKACERVRKVFKEQEIYSQH